MSRRIVWFVPAAILVVAAAGCQAIALTSTSSEWLYREVVHTPRDRTDLVDCRKLAKAAIALRDLITASVRGTSRKRGG